MTSPSPGWNNVKNHLAENRYPPRRPLWGVIIAVAASLGLWAAIILGLRAF